MTRLIVVTDLDGTLLDHHSYDYSRALPALRRLRLADIPLILNSSKTAAEMLALRDELDNHEPFIVENGAGIHKPAAAAPAQQQGEERETVALGMNRAEILELLAELRRDKGYRFTGFADMDAAALAGHTGLSPDKAALALRRDFSEPLLWEDSEPRLEDFRGELQARGVTLLRGGRFIHCSGAADKGRALDWLRDHYARRMGEAPRVIALGDGENDRAMLERADYPVLIKSPVNAPPAIRHASLLRTEQEGPAGWNTAIRQLLDRHDKGTL